MLTKQRRDLLVGLAFLAPNILGFLTFTLGPLVFSLFLAFTNWDLRLHNMFKDEALEIVFFENFTRLFDDPDFWKYLGNTLFLMLAIPFSIAGSLFAAMLLSKDMRGNDWVWKRLIAAAGLIFGVGCLVLVGADASAIVVLVIGLAGLILVGGTLGGTTVYRTLFFMPHFTSGVATFILWKKLYNPSTGPISNSLRPLLESVEGTVAGLPVAGVQGAAWFCLLLLTGLFALGLVKLKAAWQDGELGWLAFLLSVGFLGLPPLAALAWSFDGLSGGLVAGTGLAVLGVVVGSMVVRGRDYPCRSDEGLGSGLMLGGLLMVAQFTCLGLGNVLFGLPGLAAAGLEPPEWLTQYNWAKPSIMFMGLWAAIGSNNMLLYLAGLTGIPGELYEAADIDGASPFQRFWYVTWPQLAPVTFFIVIMSVIGGLQGGFEMARVMTEGGPAGSTTTLSYFVYNEGFSTGRLGYAAGISWAMFALVFAVTLFNWKFGNRQVND
ncbi:MAG: ABC transporter permease subunit [Candidatus Latescibacteria bacterium]|nr:ABC transporter permease subunit [Candidatus Latescibacterota bacterium]